MATGYEHKPVADAAAGAASAAGRLKAHYSIERDGLIMQDESGVEVPLVAGLGKALVNPSLATTDATVTDLAVLEMSAAPNDTTVAIKGTVQVYETATGDQAVFEFVARAIKASGGALTAKAITFTNGPSKDAGAAAWDLTFDDDGTTFRLRVTGEAAHNLKWTLDSFAIVRTP